VSWRSSPDGIQSRRLFEREPSESELEPPLGEGSFAEPVQSITFTAIIGPMQATCSSIAKSAG